MCISAYGPIERKFAPVPVSVKRGHPYGDNLPFTDTMLVKEKLYTLRNVRDDFDTVTRNIEKYPLMPLKSL